MPGDFDEREAKIEEARQAAVTEMFDQGYDIVLEAAKQVKLPHLLGAPLGKILPLETIEKLTTDMLGAPQESRPFVIALSAVARERFGPEWEDRVRTLRSDRLGDADVAFLLLGWPDAPSTWDFATSLGEGVEREYWLGKQPFRLSREDDEAVQRAIGKYLDVGRPSGALSVINDRLERTDAHTIFRILDALPNELGGDRPVDQLVGYMVEKAFDALGGRKDVDVTEVARREYMYLGLLRFREKHLAIHRLMATDPGFYFSVIADVFKASSDESKDEPSPEKSARAKAGYTLLSEFRTVPGRHEASVNYDELRSWVDNVRKLAAENDRIAITDEFIGHILAHSPADDEDELWPHRAVRQIIEDLRSDSVEEGFAVEKYNSRGVVTKALFEGGKQERKISDEFRALARKITAPRTSALLHRMADHYARYADSEDLRAEQEKMSRH
jgi:hypothetical protein